MRSLALGVAAALVFVFTIHGAACWQAFRRSPLDVIATDARAAVSPGLRDAEPAPEPIALNEVVRSTVAARQVVLPDGSHVEMLAGSELRVERADDGLALRLHRGGVTVDAAGHLNRRLYVKTHDVTVKAVAAVFVVEVAAEGARVTATAGEVDVHRGNTATRLQAGQRLPR